MTVEGSPEPTNAVIGDLMITGLPERSSGESVRTCRDALAQADARITEIVLVAEDGRVVGLVWAGELLRSPPDRKLGELMSALPPPLDPSTPVEPAVARMVHRREPLIAVSDERGGVEGVVPPERLTAPLLAEHEEDLARLGGYRAGSRSALRAAEEPLSARLVHRLPWLIVGLAGAMISVVIVGSFEEQIDQVILLAFFVPAVVYLADSVGTQTETLLIRALAADVHLRGVIRKELLTGLFLGITVAVLFYPFVLIGWGAEDVALAVSLALLCSCSIATAVAMVLPITLQRLGMDPAFGSGPLATVVQDLLSILIYFAIGVSIVT